MENVERFRSQRNYSLLLFEIIACILIVFIHVRFPGEVGQYIVFSARFGVPLFFVVGGYFMIGENTTKEELRNKLKVRLKRLTFLLVLSAVLYFVLGITTNCMYIKEYLANTFTLNNLYYFLLFNRSFFTTPSWYLLATIVAYLIIYLFPNMFIKHKWFLICISCILLVTIVLHILIFRYNVIIFGVTSSDSMTMRNWLFNALPFISFGILLSRLKHLFNKLNNKFVIISLFISFLLMIGELDLYRRLLGAYLEFGIFTITFVTLAIIFSERYPNMLSKSKFMNIKGKWTPFVYIFHSAFITAVGYMLCWAPDNLLVSIIRPILVILLTVPFSIGFSYLLLYIKEKRERKKQIDEKE